MFKVSTVVHHHWTTRVSDRFNHQPISAAILGKSWGSQNVRPFDELKEVYFQVDITGKDEITGWHLTSLFGGKPVEKIFYVDSYIPCWESLKTWPKNQVLSVTDRMLPDMFFCAFVRQDPSLLDVYGVTKNGPADGKDSGTISGRTSLGPEEKLGNLGVNLYEISNIPPYPQLESFRGSPGVAFRDLLEFS